uniref:Transmembrane protein n=1 Tax=Populus davidiana TaxID=266767 RepID=A0A6M2F4I3_9ROSI
MFKHVTIAKRSLKSQGTAEEGLRNCGSSAARLVHALPLRKDRVGEIRNGFLPSSLSSSAATTLSHAKHQNTTSKVSGSVSFFGSLLCCRFFFVFGLLFFPSPGGRSWQLREEGWRPGADGSGISGRRCVGLLLEAPMRSGRAG